LAVAARHSTIKPTSSANSSITKNTGSLFENFTDAYELREQFWYERNIGRLISTFGFSKSFNGTIG
jgi:hypothetical protein